jgi:hypothetical protein
MTEGQDMTHHRGQDPNGIRIVREIPMWGIWCVLGAGLLQAVLMWSSQREQATAIAALTEQVSIANATINRLTAEIGSKNIKDVEHDMALRDMERRLNLVESRSNNVK